MAKRKRTRTSTSAFTVEMPRALEATRDGDAWWTEVDGRELRLSNLTKVFWPDEGYTKGDLLAYYHNVASLIVPHLGERPLTMKRMPDGIDGPFFYEKSAPSHTPDWLGRCVVQSEDAKSGEIDYLTIADAAGLLYIANLGCIEFHLLHRGAPTPHTPTTCSSTSTRSSRIRTRTCSSWRATSRCCSTSSGCRRSRRRAGRPGCRSAPVVRGTYSYDMVRAFVGAAGRLIKGADPDRVTMAWKVADRTGKIFIDHNMNRSGANIAAVYSLRPEARAPVSTPPHLGRGVRGRVRAGRLPHRQRLGTVRARGRRVRRGANRGGRPDDGARGARRHAAEIDEAQRIDVEAPLPRTAARTVAGRTSRRSPPRPEIRRCSSTCADATSAPRARASRPPARSRRPATRS